MIRILQATCESRLFFLYIPQPHPHPDSLPPPPKCFRLLITLNINQCLLVSLGIFPVAFISVVYSIYLSRR